MRSLHHFPEGVEQDMPISLDVALPAHIFCSLYFHAPVLIDEVFLPYHVIVEIRMMFYLSKALRSLPYYLHYVWQIVDRSDLLNSITSLHNICKHNR